MAGFFDRNGLFLHTLLLSTYDHLLPSNSLKVNKKRVFTSPHQLWIGGVLSRNDKNQARLEKIAKYLISFHQNKPRNNNRQKIELQKKKNENNFFFKMQMQKQ